MKTLLALSFPLLLTCTAIAHEGHSHAPSPEMQKKIEHLNTDPAVRLVLQRNAKPTLPDVASVFEPFAATVKVRRDNQFLYVESDGMPDHPMMIGITAWQQQVPLPQSYVGSNAWRIPLHPTPAKNPLSAKSHFFRGAIALAANGVPIFNPIKNDGKTDTLVAGELDQWGGHCGRADDYHYHVAPVHLEKIVGQGNPLAVALDGYLIYGYNDPDGTPPTKLDWLNGHKDSNGDYHYHATKTYPYLNGGFYGEVIERDGQVDPQPRAQGVRPALTPLRGAKITGFEHPNPESYVVRYDVSGEERSVEYTIADTGSTTFHFVSPQGTKTERYTPRPAGREGRRNDQRPEQGSSNPPQNAPRGNGRAANDQPPPGGGGDPIVRVLDANRDGQIDNTELRGAAVALRTLDVNKDGKISSDELRVVAQADERKRANLPGRSAFHEGLNRATVRVSHGFSSTRTKST